MDFVKKQPVFLYGHIVMLQLHSSVNAFVMPDEYLHLGIVI